jgi:hypothetical protein
MRVVQMFFKNYDEFVELIKSCDFKCVEADYNKSTPAPYLVFFKGDESGVYADSELLWRNAKIIIELYTAKDDHKSETNFEKWLADNNLGWTKPDRAWDTTNKLCVSYYNLSVTFDE